MQIGYLFNCHSERSEEPAVSSRLRKFGIATIRVRAEVLARMGHNAKVVSSSQQHVSDAKHRVVRSPHVVAHNGKQVLRYAQNDSSKGSVSVRAVCTAASAATHGSVTHLTDAA